ncbi:3'-5' exonuclease, partial [Entomophthora muscae]
YIGFMETTLSYRQALHRYKSFPSQSKLKNVDLEPKAKRCLSELKNKDSQDIQSSKPAAKSKKPSFIEKARKKANEFKLVEALDEKRKLIETDLKTTRYILSLDELDAVYPGQGCENKLKLMLQDSPGLAPPPSQLIAMDCEMVGSGPKGSISKLGRVSLVDYYGNVIYDTFVFQKDVTDYRTWISGIEAKDLKNAPSFSDVQQKVKEHLQGHSVVGHSLMCDFEALKLPKSDFKTHDLKAAHTWLGIPDKSSISLRILTFNLLGLKIQTNNHSSIIDAQASMAVYRKLLSRGAALPKWKPRLQS